MDRKRCTRLPVKQLQIVPAKMPQVACSGCDDYIHTILFFKMNFVQYIIFPTLVKPISIKKQGRDSDMLPL